MCVFLQASEGVCVCQCGRGHVFSRLAGESLSYLISFLTVVMINGGCGVFGLFTSIFLT